MNKDRLDVPLIDMANQKAKDCKKQTPDFAEANPSKGKVQVGYKVKNLITLRGAVCLYNNSVLDGHYYFDSYDAYDNTCYVSLTTRSLTYNVLFSDLLPSAK